MSTIIFQDISQVPSPLQIDDRSTLSSRDLTILEAFENEPWNLGPPALVDQKFARLDRDLLFQIVMVENTSKSKLNQVDDIRAKLDPTLQRVDRLKTTRDRVVINQVDIDKDEPTSESAGTTASNQSRAVFKLVLQDRRGSLFYAINSSALPWLQVCMLGSKVIVKRGSIFNRGVFVLQEPNVLFLGGINRAWNENRDGKLCEYLESKLQRDAEDVKLNGTRKRKNTR
ncbi:hypothetical protein ZYGR_0AF00300 [Zygosaccharomyces rouxii]|uniref:RecQ mediated genome instability protein 1 OB-fold domain-containing protein n=1 Tax=Zygosaccharomyces rouxii TaxID=4956 RepID=A0A1Q3A755_ZYGRO|nr:hypothetical protein ZYGR_0AF00300 [Zygosaccharomyces rouxii]